MKTIQRHRGAALALLCLSLAACGDGNPDTPDGPPTAVDGVPASAKATASGYTQFAAGLMKSETAPPVDVSLTTPPTSETEAPQPI